MRAVFSGSAKTGSPSRDRLKNVAWTLAVTGAYLTQLAGATFIDYFAHDQDWGEGGMQGAIERKFDLLRRHEFALEFVEEAAQRVFSRNDEGTIANDESEL